MKKWWVWALVAAVLVVLVVWAVKHHRESLVSITPQCQACHDQTVATAQQCDSNACTSAGGQNFGTQGCQNIQNQSTYNSLIQACVAQERSSLNYCNSFYHCSW